MLLVLLKWDLKKISHGTRMTLQCNPPPPPTPILNLLLYITLLIMVLTCVTGGVQLRHFKPFGCAILAFSYFSIAHGKSHEKPAGF